MPRELGICFSAALIPPIMAGLKTVTRRIVTPQPEPDPNNPGFWIWRGGKALLRANYGADYVHTDECALRRAIQACARYQVGDLLYVKECHSTSALDVYPCPKAWYRADFDEFDNPAKMEHSCPPEYRDPRSRDYGNYADCFACWQIRHGEKFRWMSGRFMPRKFARTWLEVLYLRAERLQEITNNDVLLEGIKDLRTLENGWDLRDCFRATWDKLHARGDNGWDKNPWVVRYEFRRITR